MVVFHQQLERALFLRQQALKKFGGLGMQDVVLHIAATFQAFSTI